MTHYTPTPEDLAAYQRQMLRHEGLRDVCPCFTEDSDCLQWCAICLGWDDSLNPLRRVNYAHRSGCTYCHGLGYVAPPPEWWLGLLVRVAGYAVMWWSPEEAGDSCWLAEVHGGAAYPGMFPESALLAALEAAAVP